MSLLQECIESLDLISPILTKVEEKVVQSKMIKDFPFTQWARVDWDKVNNKRCSSLDKIDVDISDIVSQFGDDIYIVWSEATLPILSTKIKNSLACIIVAAHPL